MIVVLDTNVLCQDWHLAGSNFRTFFEGVKAVPVSLKIPAVVMDEVVNKFRETLLERLREASAGLHAMGQLLGREPAPTPTVDVVAEAARYRKHVENLVAGCSGEVLPYPKITHEKVVERELARRKPFRENGAGYRDLLIWESVRPLVLWGHERVAFITANSRDFGEGPGLHADFAEDLVNKNAIRIFRSLKAFNDEHVVPRLTMLDEVRRELESNGHSFDLGRWLTGNLFDRVRDADLNDLFSPFPDGVGRVWPSELLEIHKIAVDEVREFAGKDLLVRVTVVADFVVSVDVEWDDYLRSPEVRKHLGGGGSFSSSWWYETQRTSISLDLVLGWRSGEIESDEIVRLSTDYGTFES